MDEEHVRKLATSMMRGYLDKSAPKPTVDVSLCENCGKMTDSWITQWPKKSKITWICKECKNKLVEKNKANLENILEKMCDEESK